MSSRHRRPGRPVLAPLLGALAVAGCAGGAWWIGQDASAANATKVAMQAADKDCGDFTTQGEAQTYFDGRGYSSSSDPERLDADNDGVPCEDLPAATGTPTSLQEAPQVDRGSVSPEDQAAIDRGELNAK